MIKINPHINFNGNTEEAFIYYQSIFGGNISEIMRFQDIATSEFPIDEPEANKIMRITLSIGDSYLIANDVPSFMGKTNENENRSKIAISIDTKAEANRIFESLAVGGSVEMPMSDAPWGLYYGGLRDKYGIEWTFECKEN